MTDDKRKVLSIKTRSVYEAPPTETPVDEKPTVEHVNTASLQEGDDSPITTVVALAMHEDGGISFAGSTIVGLREMLALLDMYHHKLLDEVLYGR